MTTAPTLTDGVVRLRAHRVEDLARIVEQCLDPESQRWTPVPAAYTLADARHFVDELVPTGWRDGSGCYFAIEVDDAFGGSVGLRPQGAGRAEIGYGAHPAIRGTGAVERALRLLLEWGFAELDLSTVQWQAGLGNWASRKVAWRLGFSFDGILRDWRPRDGELQDGWVGTLRRDDPREPSTTWLVCPVVDGHGVRLRPFTQADVPRIVEARTDPEVRQWLGADAAFPFVEDSARRWLERLQEARANASGVVWAIADPAEPEVALGALNLMHLRPGHDVELGYWLHPDARGRGLATRASLVGLNHAFGQFGVRRVEAWAAAGNAASQRVLERAGLRRLGLRRGADRLADGSFDDLVGYDLLATEFFADR